MGRQPVASADQAAGNVVGKRCGEPLERRLVAWRQARCPW
jgi:hypothetical protein